MTARADVLVGTNGERFVGPVVEETADSVVFASELGGRLTLPRKQVRELRRTPASQFLFNYRGNFSEVNGTENAHNRRVNANDDLRLNLGVGVRF